MTNSGRYRKEGFFEVAHRSGQKEESRARILAAAGRGFRRHGFGGLGVDGLATEAGVPSGAFYAHFKSKAAAFREAVTAGIRALHDGIEAMRAANGAGWREAFVDLYLGERRTCALADSCALQSLSVEVARADDDVRAAYEAELRQVIANRCKDHVPESLIRRIAQAIDEESRQHHDGG